MYKLFAYNASIARSSRHSSLPAIIPDVLNRGTPFVTIIVPSDSPPLTLLLDKSTWKGCGRHIQSVMVPLPREQWCICKPGVREMVISKTGAGLVEKEGESGERGKEREFEVKEEEVEFPPGIAMAPRVVG